MLTYKVREIKVLTNNKSKLRRKLGSWSWILSVWCVFYLIDISDRNDSCIYVLIVANNKFALAILNLKIESQM